MLYQILTLLVAHWIADFVLQTHWMAQNKSKSNDALLYHVLTYTTCMTVASVFVFPPVHAVSLWIVINSIAHFATDWVTSRWSARYFGKEWHNFFVVVGFDQLLHYTTLLLTARWLGLL